MAKATSIVKGKHLRKLSVYSKASPRQYYSYAMLPEIRLHGCWLQSIGFKSGDAINVICQRNKITITHDLAKCKKGE